MFIVQQNCVKGYKCTIAALEAGLGLNAYTRIFLGNRSIAHLGFNLSWPSGINNRKDMRVLIAVRKDILSKVVIENRTDLVNHPYYIVLNIRELHPQSIKCLRKTRVVN